jgi:hypothetical protein
MTLERVDTLIAFATIMLGISLLITILNQMIAAMLGHRGTYLKDGVKDLLETLDPSLEGKAETIAENVLTHRLASDSFFARLTNAPLRWKLATSIRPEELTKLLVLVSTGKDYENKIKAILAQANPTIKREADIIASTVNSVGGVTAVATADQLIKQLSTKASNAVGRIEAAFVSTMDRASQRFTVQMRIWTVIFSVLAACYYHVDAITIYSRLSTEPALRASLINISGDVMKNYQALASPPSDKDRPADKDTTKALKERFGAIKKELDDTNLQLFEYNRHFEFESVVDFLRVLATAGLLSLGAPFWYNALKGLASLRPAVAQKQAAEEPAK